MCLALTECTETTITLLIVLNYNTICANLKQTHTLVITNTLLRTSVENGPRIYLNMNTRFGQTIFFLCE